MSIDRRRTAPEGAGGGDPVQALLRARGCPPHVVDGGLDRLVEAWERVAASLDGSYDFGLDGWLNDMDARNLIAAAQTVAPPSTVKRLRARVAAADAKVRAHTVPTTRCLWGEGLARRNGWSAEREWWYFVRPAESGVEFAEGK